VPDVVGKSWQEAKQILADQGFKVKFKDGASEILSALPGSSVKDTNPKAGKSVDKGTTVTVSLRYG
jgi:eukaryotic-like serine/threonine-protein kinase